MVQKSTKMKINVEKLTINESCYYIVYDKDLKDPKLYRKEFKTLKQAKTYLSRFTKDYQYNHIILGSEVKKYGIPFLKVRTQVYIPKGIKYNYYPWLTTSMEKKNFRNIRRRFLKRLKQRENAKKQQK